MEPAGNPSWARPYCDRQKDTEQKLEETKEDPVANPHPLCSRDAFKPRPTNKSCHQGLASFSSRKEYGGRNRGCGRDLAGNPSVRGGWDVGLCQNEARTSGRGFFPQSCAGAQQTRGRVLRGVRNRRRKAAGPSSAGICGSPATRPTGR